MITNLLNAGADTKVRDTEGKTPFDYAKDNEKLKGTEGYWALHDAQYD
jgi:ankyrin repeat protein